MGVLHHLIPQALLASREEVKVTDLKPCRSLCVPLVCAIRVCEEAQRESEDLQQYAPALSRGQITAVWQGNMSAALRHALKQVQQEAPQLARSVRTSAGPRYHYDYEHGPNYLNFQDWPGRQWKVGATIIGMIVSGIGVPSFAVWWHQSKARGS